MCRAVLENIVAFASCLPGELGGRNRESFPAELSSSLLSLARCHWWRSHSGGEVFKRTHGACDSKQIDTFPFTSPCLLWRLHPISTTQTAPNVYERLKRSSRSLFVESVNWPWILWSKSTNGNKSFGLRHNCSDEVQMISMWLHPLHSHLDTRYH